MNIIMRTFPQNASPVKRPDPSNHVAYGEYLVTAASCGECHTKKENGKVTGRYLAGGQAFPMPDGSIITSYNLTPDKTGIGDWPKDEFIQSFIQYRDSSYHTDPVQEGHMQTIMPWVMFSGMSETDLAAIYDYLNTLDPVVNEVAVFAPAK